MRLPGAVRVGLAIVSSVTVVWIITVALFYISTPSAIRNSRPLPSQVAALVALLERASPAERAVILRAVTSQFMTARLDPGNHVGRTPQLQPVPRITARMLEDSLAALGGRPHSVSIAPDAAGKGGLGFTFATPVDLELRIQLATGDTLIVGSLRYPVANVLGVPVGFVAGLTGAMLGLLALFALRREVAINRLQLRLSHLAHGRIAMIGGISHDVRTFLTRLRLRVDRIADEEERERAVADIADMIRLLDDAVLASRAGERELTEELVDFAELVLSEIDDRRATGKPVDFDTQDIGGRNTTVLGDRLALRRVISNLLDNALVYGKVARVGLESNNDCVTLLVDDEGPGVPPEQRQRILEPFVRLEHSRSRRTGGAGLGLAVARTLVEAHDGTISVGAAPGGGARLMVRLPLFVPS